MVCQILYDFVIIDIRNILRTCGAMVTEAAGKDLGTERYRIWYNRTSHSLVDAAEYQLCQSSELSGW